MIPLLVVSVLISLCLGAIWQKHQMRREANVPKPCVLLRDAQVCKDILSGGDLQAHKFDNVLTLLESRAGPNHRLVHAFEIDNAFTTTDKAYYRGFMRNARLLVAKDESTWRVIRDLMVDHVRFESQSSTINEAVSLVPLVQAVVLKTTMYTLFDLPLEKLDVAKIRLIAVRINSLWIESKSTKKSSRFVEDRRELERTLRTILPVAKEYTSKKNPLNLILPAYETLWRVVLRGFLEVLFRGGEAGTEWRQALLTFLADPTSSTFKHTAGDAGISVAFIVAETLRLYPPTRRIYRHVKREYNTDLPELFAADIEFLHRDANIWGEDSLYFKPSRWKDVSKECQDAYMPFGWKSFTCPAKDNFGPRMIGLAVAALVAEFEHDWTWCTSRDEDEIDVMGPLEAGRDSYITLGLERENSF